MGIRGKTRYLAATLAVFAGILPAISGRSWRVWHRSWATPQMIPVLNDLGFARTSEDAKQQLRRAEGSTWAS
jgi:hypothetical protein